jgi:hypothetical protein|nr:MAG TPA: hypothetical protein [Caudoviricetes sp.]
MARNGFSNPEQRKKAQNTYEKTEKGKLARAKANARNGTKRFIEEFATREELEALLIKIEEKLKAGN